MRPDLSLHSVVWPEWPVLEKKRHFTVGLVIQVWNRPGYLKRMLSSLSASDLSDTIIILADDASDDEQTLELLRSIKIKNVPVVLLQRLKRAADGNSLGYKNLFIAWELLLDTFSCDYLAVLDSDTLVKANWLQRLLEVYRYFEPDYPQGLIVSGFNAQVHYPVWLGKGVIRKESMGGICMLFRSDMYRRHGFDACLDICWDWLFNEKCHKLGVPLLFAVPSVVQHIGRQGVWSLGLFRYDWAPDYTFSPPWSTIVGGIGLFLYRGSAALRKIGRLAGLHLIYKWWQSR